MGVVGQVMGASSSAWRWLRREFALAVPLICGVCVPLAAQLPATALANANWGTGVEASLPAGADASNGVAVSDVSCASAGNCAAVGQYSDNSGNGNLQGLLLSESVGAWGAGVEATLPANATNANQDVVLDSVSCGSAGNCAAVGTYLDSSSGVPGLLLTESSGAWGAGVEASLPANASGPVVNLYSVSCASPGNCTAVGNYMAAWNLGLYQALVLGENAAPGRPESKRPCPPTPTLPPLNKLPTCSRCRAPQRATAPRWATITTARIMTRVCC